MLFNSIITPLQQLSSTSASTETAGEEHSSPEGAGGRPQDIGGAGKDGSCEGGTRREAERGQEERNSVDEEGISNSTLPFT